MASARIKIIAASAVLALGAGYGLYFATAQVVPPVLAQSPLNIEVQVPPAFIMALDDSGSMNWETLNNTRDGVFTWRTGTGANSFYNSSNVAYGYGDSQNGDARRYLMLFPYAGRNNQQNAVPPIDRFGFARSPQYNPAYFNPFVTYEPWKNEDGSVYQTIDPAAAPVDPRLGAAPAGSNTGGYNKINTTFNLTANVENRNGGWRFRVHDGMVLPAGLRYWMLDDDDCGNMPGDEQEWETLGSDVTLSGIGGDDCQLGIRYFPATFYLTTDTVPGYSATPVTVANPVGVPAGTTLYRYEIKPANYATTAAYDAAIQNFAHYFTYYRTRREALASSLLNALVDVNNMRIGWFWINDRRNVTMRDMQVTADRVAIYDDFKRIRASGGTPSRTAVRYAGEQFKRTGTNAPVQLSCQKNASMLFTDGYINDGSSPTVGNLDGALGAPFADGFGSTMADIVVPYYYESLVPGLEENGVPVPSECAAVPVPPLLPAAAQRRLDCQTNLHMNFYGITLGTKGAQFGVSYNPDPADPTRILPDPYLNPPTWESRGDMAPKAVDEMWHATLNARGEMINASSPSDVTAAMRRILAVVGGGVTPAGTIGVTGSRIGASSLSVQPRYTAANTGTDWYSTLTAETVVSDPLSGAASFAQAWEASAKLEVQGSRNIQFGRTTTSVVPAVNPFTAGNVTLANLCSGPLSRCSASEISALGSGIDISEAVAYLRGDRTLEGTGELRTRTSLLGDIINSSPVVSSPTDNYGYRALGGTLGSSYETFLAAKAAANRPMVYVGANDGMLHAFDGRTTAAGGDEVFAYVPATALGHMGNLLYPYVAADQNDQKFQHRYYVDGPISVSDINVGGVWKTIMVGTSGAGGRSVFALDVTNPSAITVLWEVNNLITSNSEISGNMGHVLGKPVIVPVKSGAGAISWKVIFGNGFNSNNLQARLFIVDAGTGAVQTIAADEVVSPALPYNGLASIVAVDRQRLDGGAWVAGRDGFVDTVYGADQNGAVWKFDLPTSAVALGGEPLFVARDSGGNRQTITGGLTAATGPAGGVMVYFGTGSFAFDGDAANGSQQTLYAILDRGSPVSGRGDLLQQTVGSDAGGFRGTSDNAMTAGSDGWYIDLPASERFVGTPRIESGVVFFPTYEPTGGSAEVCGVSGTNWLYGLKALSGGAALSQVRVGSPTGTSPAQTTGAVALNTGGTAPVRDVAAFTAPRLAPLTGTPTQAEIDDALAAQCSMVIRVAGADPLYLPRPCGRQSWRQVR